MFMSAEFWLDNDCLYQCVLCYRMIIRLHIWISDILHALELLYVHIVYNFIDNSLFQWIVTMEQTPIVDHHC